MVFKAVSEKIVFDAVKESTTLTGEALAKKQARDKELEAIIKGEDDRTLLVIGPCSSDNEDAVLDYAHRLAFSNYDDKVRAVSYQVHFWGIYVKA